MTAEMDPHTETSTANVLTSEFVCFRSQTEEQRNTWEVSQETNVICRAIQCF